MEVDVYISYSHENKSVADAVCSGLESRGIRCWIAPRDIRPGENFPQAILNAINESRIMVLIFSAISKSSPHISRELTKAASRGIIVIPFRIENVPIPEALEYIIGLPHWFDAIEPPLEKHIEKLGHTINLILDMKKS